MTVAYRMKKSDNHLDDQTRRKKCPVCTVILRTAGRFAAHRCFREARSLSYVTLLSLVPFISVILVLLSGLPFYPSLKERFLLDISSVLLPESGYEMTAYLDSIPAGGKQVGVIGLLFSLGVSFSLVLSFSRAVNSIWGTIRSDHLLKSFLKFVALVVLAPTFIIITFTLQHYTFILKAAGWLLSLLPVPRGSLLPSFREVATKGFSLVLNWGLLAFVYGLIPHGKVKTCLCVISGISAGTLWWVLRLGLKLYIEYIPQMNLLYGSLAFIPVFLIWLYGTWIIVLFGVELNYSLHFKDNALHS